MEIQKSNKRELGSEKEKLAAAFLTEHGYKILETNYFCRAGEIDIIAAEGDYLCFIEVKFRSDLTNGYPEEAVDLRKAGRITKSALFFMSERNFPEDTPCRFDVISILGDRITLIKNAFDASL